MRESASHPSTIETLEKSDIIRFSDDGDMTLTSKFDEAVDEERSRLDNGGVSDSGVEQFFESVDIDPDLSKEYPNLFAIAIAIDRLSGRDIGEDIWDLAIAIDQIREEPPKTGGVPNGFLPLRAHRVGMVADLYSHVIAYFWREDCDPCDEVAANLEDINHERLDEATRVAAHGPSAPKKLYEEYDIGGGPTLLFFSGGKVKTRVLGPTTVNQIEHCVDILFE